MKPWTLFFLSGAFSCVALSTRPNDVESAHASEPDPAIAKMVAYLFGSGVPKEVEHVIKRKLIESAAFQASLRRISESSGDSSDEESDGDMRRMVMEAVHEALEETRLLAADAQLQLAMKEKEVRQERYKFLLGAAGTCTAAMGLIGTLIAYNTAGC